jgi:hypothetical protein
MPEHFSAVDRHDGNVVLIFLEQFRIRFDIDLSERKLILTASGLDRVLRLVAEVAPGSGINNYMRFGQLTTPSNWEYLAEVESKTACQLITKQVINVTPTTLYFVFDRRGALHD